MKNLIILIAFLSTISTFAQKQQIKTFVFQNKEIEYKRIDYSKYGVGLFFITMYEKSDLNKNILRKSVECLNNKNRLYHTLYYFVEIPAEINDLKLKNKLFSEFLKHLKITEKIEKAELYLNMQSDYSSEFKLSKNENYNIMRLTTGIEPRKICKTLTVR